MRLLWVKSIIRIFPFLVLHNHLKIEAKSIISEIIMQIKK